MGNSCIDLRTICKERRWRWRYDDPSITARNDDAAWHVEVRCRNGTIYPFGGDDLRACVEGHAKIVAKLRALGSEIQPHQGAVVFKFPMALLDRVAEVMRPRMKRAGPSHTAGIEALARWRNSQGTKTAVESPQTGSPVPKAS